MTTQMENGMARCMVFGGSSIPPRETGWTVLPAMVALVLFVLLANLTPGVIAPTQGSLPHTIGIESSVQNAITAETGEAGYVLLNGQTGSVKAVFDTYTQPSATCVPGTNVSAQNMFVGPGLYAGSLDFSSFNFYQLGTEVLCPTFTQNPVYFAFYLLIVTTPSDPSGDYTMVNLPGFTVHPGDSINSTLVSSTNKVTFTLSDLTLQETVSRTISAAGFAPNGAACLMEPFGNTAKFSVTPGTCTATVNGATGGIGTFSSPNILYRFILLNAFDGTTVQALTSFLASDGATFLVTWISSSPLQLVPSQFIDQRLAPGFAGYLLVNSEMGSVSGVFDSYTQPTATCDATEFSNGHFPGDQNALVGSALYLGSIDLSSYQFYAVGTEALCPIFYANPIYYAFYLVAVVTPSNPNGTFTMMAIPGFTVNPGDSMSSAVLSSLNEITFILTDLTTHETSRASIVVSGVAPNGAGCFLEPFGNLAEFSTVTQSCQATVDGVTRGIGAFSSPNVLDRFNLINTAGTVQASASPLAQDAATFSITWKTSQPLL